MKDRLEFLKELLEEGKLSTQDELRKKLEKEKYKVTQSTISRDLRKIGAVRAVDAEGNAVYRLPDLETPEAVGNSDIVLDVEANDSMVVIHTTPGAASMVARQLDFRRSEDFLGTIAGDDTVFVALSKKCSASRGIKLIREMLKPLE